MTDKLAELDRLDFYDTITEDTIVTPCDDGTAVLRARGFTELAHGRTASGHKIEMWVKRGVDHGRI